MAMFNRPVRHDRSALVASAMSVNPGDESRIRRIAAAYQEWQAGGWVFYDKLAEVHYPANYTSSALARFSYLAGVRSAESPLAAPAVPDVKDRTDVDRVAQEILWALEGPQGDINALAGLYSINDDISGEGYLTGVDHGSGRNAYTDWEYLSILELRAGTDGGWTRSGVGFSDDQTPTPGSYKAFVKRMWAAHPARTFVADSPLQALADDCRRLIALNDSMTSRILNRMAQAGILFIPSGLSVVGANEAPEGSTDPVKSPFWLKFLDTVEKAILKRNTAAGALPIILQGNEKDGAAIRHVVMDRTIDRVEMELRAELRQNIAMGQNLPSESQTGLGNATHFQLWGITDDAYQGHLLPKAQRWANNLTREYLWPGLRSYRKERGLDNDPMWSEEEIRRRVVIADGASVVTKPNMAEDRRQLHDRLVISDDALRGASGATDADIPEDNEYVRQLGRKINNPYLATFGLKVADEIDWDKVANTPNGEGAPGAGSIPPTRRPADSSDPPGKRSPKAAADTDPVLLAAAASGHLLAARKAVGARLRALAQAKPEIAAEIRNVANEQVLAAVDLDELDLGIDAVAEFFTQALAPLAVDLTDQADPDTVAAFVAAVAGLAAIKSDPALSDLRRVASGVMNPRHT